METEEIFLFFSIFKKFFLATLSYLNGLYPKITLRAKKIQNKFGTNSLHLKNPLQNSEAKGPL